MKTDQIFACVTASRQTTYFLYKPEFFKNVYSNVEQKNHFFKREATQQDFVSGSSDKGGSVQKKKRYYYLKKAI